MHVRLTQIDGKLPNLPLMKLAAFHRARGDEIVFTKHVERDLMEPEYDRVYGSAIFNFSADRVRLFRSQFPDAIVGGTWNAEEQKARGEKPITVEAALGTRESEDADYSIYPRFDASIGFTQRGCRLKCKFCVVPWKEGPVRTVNTVTGIWRGAGYPKHLHLLDNDFFGQTREAYEAHLDAILSGGFKVCLNQGINIRLINDETASRLAQIPYYDDGFKTRRLYTAWDNIGDEERFFRGIDTLERHGIPATHVMAYMLIGYDRRETWERVLYRLNRMVARGIRPFPMVYGDAHRTLPLGGCNQRVERKTLSDFRRWVIRKSYTFKPFEAYDPNAKGRLGEAHPDLFEEAPE